MIALLDETAWGCILNAEIRKKLSIAGEQINMKNDSVFFMHDAADERITVGGVFTIDGKCSTMHGEKSPVRD